METHIGDRGDCIYTYDKNEYVESIKENYFQSNLASGEPEYNQICLSKSSATFIVSPSEITIEQNIDNIIHSDTNMELLSSTREDHNHQQLYIWLKENWISLVISAGMIVVFIVVIITFL